MHILRREGEMFSGGSSRAKQLLTSDFGTRTC